MCGRRCDKDDDDGVEFVFKLESGDERRRRRHERREERRERRRERYEARREGRTMRRHQEYGERGSTLYRSRSGMVCGVCKGIAQYYGFDVFWTRAGAVALALMTAFWPCVFLYVIAAMVMKPEPVLPLESEEDEEFYNSYSGSRTMALHRLKRTYDNLDRRIQRLESAVTARDFDWDERLNR